MGCFRSLAFAAAFGMSVVATARAADMAFPPMEGDPITYQQPAVELGTGWYLRGDAGWARDRAPTIGPDLGLTASSLLNSYSLDIGFGYKFNNWLRADLIYDYRKPQTANPSTVVWCPYTAQPLQNNATPPVGIGFFANPNDTCNRDQTEKMSRQDLLLNGYVDIGTWAGVTPYIGAGLGVVQTHSTGTVSYFETANGTPYAADLTPPSSPITVPQWVDVFGNPVTIGSNGLPVACSTTPCPQPNFAFTKQNLNKKLESTKYGLAWALMGGFAIDVTSHLKLDIGYRYVNFGTITGLDANGNAVKEKQSTQEIRAGFRYMID